VRDVQGEGGTWTPGALMGPALRKRLKERAGLTFCARWGNAQNCRGVLDYVDRNQRKRGLASASLKSGSMAASGPVRDEPDPWPCVGSQGQTGHGRITAKSTRPFH